MTKKMNQDTGSDVMLDQALADLARAQSTPSETLIARVLADAETTQSSFAPAKAAPAALRRQGAPESFWQDVLLVLGGWKAMAGLTVAALIGVWIGLYPPAGMDPAGFAEDVATDSYANLIDVPIDGGADDLMVLEEDMS